MRSASQIKTELQAFAQDLGHLFISEKARGAIIGNLNKALGDDEYRYRVCAWLFDLPYPAHAHDLLFPNPENEGEYYGYFVALDHWIDPWKDDDGWHVGENFEAEALEVLAAALRNDPPPEHERSMVDEAVFGLGARVRPLPKAPSLLDKVRPGPALPEL